MFLRASINILMCITIKLTRTILHYCIEVFLFIRYKPLTVYQKKPWNGMINLKLKHLFISSQKTVAPRDNDAYKIFLQIHHICPKS